jgi:hypothetical protein
MILVSLDPGTKHCGVAVFQNTELYTAALVKTQGGSAARLDVVDSMGKAVQGYVNWHLQQLQLRPTNKERVLFVSEFPQFYQDKGSKIDADDLMMLASVVGSVRNGLDAVTETYAYLPREWKGQVPKKIHNRRVEAALRVVESERVAWPLKSMKHNVLDAIGIGLFQLARMNLRHKTRGPE